MDWTPYWRYYCWNLVLVYRPVYSSKKSPVSDSPTVVKVADPFSNLVISSYDDNEIPENSFPNLPKFPENQIGEFTMLIQSETYNWNITDFDKPKKEDLVIYEILVRDFDKERSFQNLIDRIDYFKNLKAQGEAGRAKITQITRYGTVILR